MAARFISIDRTTPYLLPPSIDEWLAESHLARFVVDVVAQLDTSAIEKCYSGRGSDAWHPKVLISLLFYGYATGTFSSRKLERATHDSIAFRYICGNQQPDHDSIATFRRRFLNDLESLFVQILHVGREMGLIKLGNVSVDGTKVKANASKHKALSWAYANRLEAQFEEEVKELMRLADHADSTDLPDGFNIPEELEIREKRLSAIGDAKVKIEERAAERHAREMVQYNDKMAKREAKEKESGKPTKRAAPKRPEEGPKDKDQVNLTDEESRIMPTSGGGFEQAYNAQAAVDMDSMVVVSTDLSNHPNDKRELEPIVEVLEKLPDSLGKIETLVADTGYFSEHNVKVCEDHQMNPLIAHGRQPHHPPLSDRIAKDKAVATSASDNPVERMKIKLQTEEGRAIYAERKTTVEPVFGIIKHVMGFRQFSMRGLEKAKGEWRIVCMAWNIRRLFTLQAA